MGELTLEAVQEIERIHAQWIDCEVRGAGAELVALCAEDVELWGPGLPRLVGRAVTEAFTASRSSQIHSIEIANRRVRGVSGMAYLTADFTTSSSLAGEVSVTTTRGSHLWILREHGGEWLVEVVSWILWDHGAH